MAEFDYKRYLASREWAELKIAVRRRAACVATIAASPACERCRARAIEETHHLTYERVGRERLADLLGVCGPCHDFLGGHVAADPALDEFAMAAARRRAAAVLDKLPADGIYWHGQDGQPCACEECCTGARQAPRAVVLRWAGALVGAAA